MKLLMNKEVFYVLVGSMEMVDYTFKVLEHARALI